MYFKTLTLEDFQAHEKSIFNLDKGLNILVGISNSGKSSVSRALQFILMGSPWDKSWVKFGSKFCRIILETNTGITVVREKGLSVNRYILTLPNQEPQVFDSFGTHPPEIIQQALKIYEVPIDSTESLNLNVALQMDSLFLLSSVPSLRARILGKLSGATYLDHAIRSLNTEKRQTTAEKSGKELELTELQTQLDKLTPIEGYTRQIAEIETKLASLSDQEARLERIRELSRGVKAFKASWDRQTAIEATISHIDISIITELALKVDRIKAISLLSKRIVDQQYTFEKQSKLQTLLTQVDLTIIPILAEKATRVKTVKELSNKFSKNQKELVSKTDELVLVEQKYNETKEQYSVILKENGICPICNRSTGNLEYAN